MPAPPERPESRRTPADAAPRDDLSAIPSFLRRGQGGLVLPRPTTPAPAGAAEEPEKAAGFDPAALPSPISRRRVAMIAAALVVVWIAFAFSRQVGDASAASGRAAELRTANGALRDQIETLQGDLRTVQEAPYENLQGRGYGLGARHEVPFTLAVNAPSLAPDAPGSASHRVGAATAARTPIQAWLDLLFGPAP
jgi:hypothetical protein